MEETLLTCLKCPSLSSSSCKGSGTALTVLPQRTCSASLRDKTSTPTELNLATFGNRLWPKKKPGFSSLQAFQNEVTCTICMTCFIDRVTIACGHNFRRPCLCLRWEEGRAPMHCPVCRKISEKSKFKTSVALKKLAFLARQTRPQRNINSSDKICVRHEETKELFGEADRRLLCALSSESPELMAHSHSPIGWAAEDCRRNSQRKWTMENQSRNRKQSKSGN
ncbi:tripartite motif-containing protein 64-like isoform X1 [Saimiri boliviensis]|uniref:tripartite motif-containing protein 64-like isoform X1 n=1 Tax=Saimiri boliviensis TaxID=27679 RepID=UPI003D781FCE